MAEATVIPSRLHFLLGAVALLAGWAMLDIGSHAGPGGIWGPSHVILLAGYALLLMGVVECHAELGCSQVSRTAASLRTSSRWLALAGSFAFAGQLSIDLAVGVLSVSQGEMDALFDALHGQPAVVLAFYAVGPALLYIGLLIQVLVLRRYNRLSTWSASVASGGIIVIGISFYFASGAIASTLYPVGLICLLIGFVAPARLRRVER